jgi:hypothetical protein
MIHTVAFASPPPSKGGGMPCPKTAIAAIAAIYAIAHIVHIAVFVVGLFMLGPTSCVSV